MSVVAYLYSSILGDVLMTESANSSSVAFYTRPEGGHKVYKKSINCNCK